MFSNQIAFELFLSLIILWNIYSDVLLSAEHDGKLTLLTVDPAVPNGSVIG